MKIYLLLIDHSRFFFYSDESEASDDHDDSEQSLQPPPSGVRGWIHVRYKRFRSAWETADSGALLWMKKLWNWLHSWAHPDEAMLARLWSARRVDLHHPATRPANEVKTTWRDYLKKQWRRHLVWLIVNGMIAPFAVVFAPLPGPNLIGYWFAYRAIHHTLVVWGIRRVQRDKLPTEFHPVAGLDVPIERDDDGRVGHPVLGGPAPGLAEHVAWHKPANGGRPNTESSVNPIPGNPKPADFQAETSQDR